MIPDDFPVFKVIDKERCTGCECCLNVCPKQCITMKADEEGFLFPTIDNKLCIDCKLCVKTCPVINYKNDCWDPIHKCYAGYATSEETVVSSASGGMFPLIVDEFMNISDGNGFVCGVVWDKDFKRTLHVCSNDINDIKAMRSSKYIQSKKGNIYIKVKELLDNDNFVLFSGTPCECYGLKNFLRKQYNKLYIIDLVCQGPTTPLAMSQFIDSVCKNNKRRIKSVNMRYVHKTPWIPQWIKIDFFNSKSYIKLFYETVIGRAVHIMQRKSCYYCQFNGNNRSSDITLGDHHGATVNDPFYNAYGTSIIIINSEHGLELSKHIQEKANLFPVDYNSLTCKNPRITSPGIENKKRNKFSTDLIENGLNFAAKNSWSRRERIRIHIPYGIRMLVRKIRTRM